MISTSAPSPTERRAVDALRRGPLTASLVGAVVWRTVRRGRISASHGGGDYAAQMLLGRMRRKGWVERVLCAGSSVWTLTVAGLRL